MAPNSSVQIRESTLPTMPVIKPASPMPDLPCFFLATAKSTIATIPKIRPTTKKLDTMLMMPSTMEAMARPLAFFAPPVLKMGPVGAAAWMPPSAGIAPPAGCASPARASRGWSAKDLGAASSAWGTTASTAGSHWTGCAAASTASPSTGTGVSWLWSCTGVCSAGAPQLSQKEYPS